MLSILFAVLIGAGTLVSIGCSCDGSLSSSEYDALEAFFSSTKGSEWKWNTSLPLITRWNFPSSLSTPCSSMWQGLSCSGSGGECVVTALSLSGYNLHGSMPPNIKDLSNIQLINCSTNRLSGVIPNQLNQLLNLTNLDLSLNKLSGTIPPLPLTLTQLNLNVNRLTGSMPAELGQMISLTQLDLNSNSLTGYVPTELGQLTSLTQLYLYINWLTGSLPTELGQIISLTYLYLYSNSVTGSLPTELGQMTSLIQLSLYSNRLTGSLPTELGQMTSLTYLYLNSNYLAGSLPIQLGQMTSLTYLFVNSNILEGTLPTELGLMTSLTVLSLYSSSVTGSLPTELGQIISLTYLYLYSNSLTGSLPTELGQMTSLIQLSLYSNSLTGSLPTELGQMRSLTELYLYSTHVTGSLPTELGQLISLTELYLDSNRLTGSLPTELGQLTALTQLYLYSNNLTGSLPTELGQMASLIQLVLFSNSLTGSLPTELGQLTSLTQLYLYSNLLTGSLPTQLGQMTSLTVLDLKSNGLEGMLPTELCHVTSLRFLYLNSNSLTGSLPTELSQLTSLTVLYLYTNSLTGSVPTGLGHLTALIELSLYSNCLTGSLSSELQNLVLLKSLILSSNWFSNHIPVWVFGLKELLGLDLHSNYFSSMLPQNMTFLQSPLQSADMSMNMLTGSIPLLWNQLESYNMSLNLFDGGLDLLFNSTASLNQLVLLDVSHNLLSGPLPSQWTSEAVPSLQTLLLSSNCFSSSISNSFAQLSSLQNLILDAYGSAPGCSVQVPSWLRWLVKGLFSKRSSSAYSLSSEILQMPTLLTLHAAGNALTGTLPELLTGSSLVDVSLASNNIEGAIPESWQTHAKFIQLDLSCNKLSGVLSSDLVVPLLSNKSVSLPNGSTINTVFDLSVNRLSGNIPSSLYAAQGLNILDGNLFQCQEGHMPEHDVNSKVTVCGSDTMNISFYMWLGMFVFGLSLVAWIRRWYNEKWNIWQRNDGAVEFLHGVKLLCLVSAASAMTNLLVLLTAYVTMKTAASSGYSTHLYQYGWVTTAAYLHGALPSVIVVLSVVLVSVAIYMIVCHLVAEDVQTMRVMRRWMKFNYLKIGVILLCHMVVTVTFNVLYVLAVLVGLSSIQLTLVQVALGGFKLLWNSVYIGWSIKRLSFLSASGRLQLSSAMKIVTFLVSPYVATFFSDSTCFRYVITGSPVVDASFSAKTFLCSYICGVFNCYPVCGMNEVSLIYTSTSPPWLYSYQCSSALLTNYIPVLVISYLLSGLVIPVLVMTYSLQSQQFINAWLPPLLYDKFFKRTVYDHCKCSSDPIFVESPNQEHIKPLFKSYDVVSKLILNLAVMLTFGFAAPLLAVIVAVDSYSTMYMWRLLINRFILMNKHQLLNGLKEVSPQALARLKSATADSFAGLHSCWLLALVSVSFFWSIFVFDMVGDVYGAEAGGLSVLSVSLSLMCVGAVPALLKRRSKLSSYNVEMNSVSPLTSSIIVDMNAEMNSEYCRM